MVNNKLNIGCGSNWKELYPDYDGLDILDFGQKYVVDILKWNSEVTYMEVMANHFLEHFTQDELRVIFSKINKVLPINGMFRFVVPHMDKARSWILSHKTFWNEVTIKWLGEKEANKVYGFGSWRIDSIITNERKDIHVILIKK